MTTTKPSIRCAILQHLVHADLPTIEDIMQATGVRDRNKMSSNLSAAVQDELVVRKRDDITNRPAYKITDKGRAYLAGKGSSVPAPAKPPAPSPAASAVSQAVTAIASGQPGHGADLVEQLRESRAGELALSQTITEICCAIGRDPAATTTGQLPQLVREYIDAQIKAETVGLLNVIADIRKAIDDPEGRIMLGELAGTVGLIYARAERETAAHQALLDAIVPITDALFAYHPWYELPWAIRTMDMLIDAQHAYIQREAAGTVQYGATERALLAIHALLAPRVAGADDPSDINEVECARKAAEMMDQAADEISRLARLLDDKDDELIAQGKLVVDLRAALADRSPDTQAVPAQPGKPAGFAVIDHEGNIFRHMRIPGVNRRVGALVRKSGRGANIYRLTLIARGRPGAEIIEA